MAVAPHYATAHLNLGIGLEAIGDVAAARSSYEAALAIDPADVLANYNLGRHLFLEDAPDRAEPLLRRAIDGNPDFPDARIVLARVLESKGDLNGAATQLEPALRVRPDYFGALRNYADVLLGLDRLTMRKPSCGARRRWNPASFDANFKLASVLVELEQARRSGSVLRSGAAHHSDLPRRACGVGQSARLARAASRTPRRRPKRR